MFSLTPKEDKFFELFRSTAKIACEGSEMLVEFMRDEVFSEEKVPVRLLESYRTKVVPELIKKFNYKKRYDSKKSGKKSKGIPRP